MARLSMPTLKICSMNYKYKIRKVDLFPAEKKYCIGWDHRQHSWAQL